MALPRVTLVTSIPLLQRVELFDAIEELGEVDLTVMYLAQKSHGRLWTEQVQLQHKAIHVRNVKLWSQLYLNPGFIRSYLETDPELLVMMGYYAPAMQLGMRLQARMGRPWVFWGETPEVRYMNPIIPIPWLRHRVRRAAMAPLKNASEIWAIGKTAVQAYKKANPRVPVFNLPYYQDLDRFELVGRQRKTSTALRFLYCGSLSYRKGIDLVAEAFARMVHAGRDIELHIVGGKASHWFDTLDDSVRSRITFHGFLELSKVHMAYALGDVLLYPSRHDGWGMGVIEGMAAGMPVITTAQTGAGIDAVVPGEDGFLLPEPRADLLHDAMTTIYRDRHRLPTMAQHARQTAMAYGHREGAAAFTEAMLRARSAS